MYTDVGTHTRTRNRTVWSSSHHGSAHTPGQTPLACAAGHPQEAAVAVARELAMGPADKTRRHFPHPHHCACGLDKTATYTAAHPF